MLQKTEKVAPCCNGDDRCWGQHGAYFFKSFLIWRFWTSQLGRNRSFWPFWTRGGLRWHVIDGFKERFGECGNIKPAKIIQQPDKNIPRQLEINFFRPAGQTQVGKWLVSEWLGWYPSTRLFGLLGWPTRLSVSHSGDKSTRILRVHSRIAGTLALLASNLLKIDRFRRWGSPIP